MDTKFSDKELSNISVDKIEFIDINLFNNLLKDITDIDTINVTKCLINNSPFGEKQIQIFLDFTNIENIHFCIIGSNLLEIKLKIISEYNKAKPQISKTPIDYFINELIDISKKYFINIEYLTFNEYLQLNQAIREVEEMGLCKLKEGDRNE